ncbi:MAG: Gfo/Idh/MocA family oxidoreductase [Chloroflexi bacterium]|nr:Gfo/Idh/MocA family oxidoreductase [Chloroflexota bacterium]
MTTSQPTTICLVGCGGIGARHVQAAQEADEVVRYGAVFDTDPARASALVKQAGLAARVLPSWEAVLRDPAIDGIDLCLPNSLHARFAIEALQAGKHVLTEKPMALSVADCDRMIASAAAAGRLLTVIHNRRFDEPALALKALIDSGDLGDPFLVETHGIEGPGTVGRGRWLASETEGGIAMAQTVHFAYMVRWLLGPIVDVSCFTSRKGIDWMDGAVSCVILLRFASDAIGEMTSTFGQAAGANEHRITVYGGQGIATHSRNTLRVVCPARYGNDDWHEITFPNHDWGQGFGTQIAAFGRAISGQGDVAVSPSEGREAVELIEAAYRSAATRQAVRLPLA